MATEIVFPFFEILVNNIFGTIILSVAAMGVLIAILLGLSRCSWVFILYWMMFYAMVVITFYVGALGIVLMIILAGAYFFTQLIKYMYPDR